MLRDLTELGFLWEPLPDQIKKLTRQRPPSFVYFYETGAVLEFVWRWEWHYYLPKGPPDGFDVDYEKTHYWEVNVAWYLVQQTINYQTVRWQRYISPQPYLHTDVTLDNTLHDTIMALEREAWDKENRGYRKLPFDRATAQVALRHAADYLQQTNQLDLLFWSLDS